MRSATITSIANDGGRSGSEQVESPKFVGGLFYAIAVLLIATALAKLWMLLTDPYADIKTGYPLPLIWLAVFLESFAILIVFCKFQPHVKWLTFMLLFLVFTVFSVFNVLSGKTDCGCAGAISIHPGWVLAFDSTTIGLLLAVRKNVPFARPSQTFIPSWFSPGRAVGCLILVCVFLVFQTDSCRTWVGVHLFGHQVEAISVKFGAHNFRQSVDCVLVLKNHSSTPRKILGIGRSCACVIPSDVVNSVIPENGELHVPLEINAKVVGDFHQRILVYLDAPRQYVVAADLIGTFEED